jgi:hypothetical protein
MLAPVGPAGRSGAGEAGEWASDLGGCCAPEGIRTPNLLIRSQMLYPLSYGRMPPPGGSPDEDWTRIADPSDGAESVPRGRAEGLARRIGSSVTGATDP